jgi:2-polyprenyl-3-methyl-5-hydroxy-6-metoxy-1,4-benzoquinol methylase
MNTEEVLKVLQENEQIQNLDYFYFHTHRLNFLIKKLEEFYQPRKTFLDIGSLMGYLLIAAHQIGYQVFGTDLAKFVREIEKLSQKYNFTNLPADLSVNGLPFPDNYFDIIVFSEVLEHLNFHPAQLFIEIARVLKPKGIVIVTTPNLSRLNNVIKLMGNISVNAELDELYTEGTHYREYTADEVVYLLQMAGLEIRENKYINFKYPDLSWAVKISDIITNCFPKKKRDLYIVGEKK